MYTQCPQCKAYFEITTEQLKVGGGEVRCGQCLTIFNALEHLSETLPEWPDEDLRAYADWASDQSPAPPATALPDTGPSETLAEIATETDNPPLGDLNSAEAEAPEGLTERQIEAIEIDTAWLAESDDASTAHKPAQTADDDEAIAELAPEAAPEADLAAAAASEAATADMAEATSHRPMPEARHLAEDTPASTLPAPLLRQLAEEKAASLRPPNTRWVVGSLLLTLLLGAQAAYFYRDALAASQPQLRPWLEQACQYLDCRLAQPRGPQRIAIIGGNVHNLPGQPGALVATTTLVNRAPETRPYPLLGLRFSNMNGETIAQRRFLPREYLPAGVAPTAGMAPDTPIIVELPLVDPGKDAVNFEFYLTPDRRQS